MKRALYRPISVPRFEVEHPRHAEDAAHQLGWKNAKDYWDDVEAAAARFLTCKVCGATGLLMLGTRLCNLCWAKGNG